VSKFSGKAKISYVMVYDKIGYGLAGPNFVYDLKGTTNKRRKVKDGDNKTKMDLNFVEDFNSIPLPVQLNDLHRLSKSLEKDSSFLKSCNVIDYSLLLVINKSSRKVMIGIIDYLQHYTFDKVIENTYKSVLGSEMPTVVDPAKYRSRFFDTIVNKYFMTGDQ
jgi:1-phosphatidylinositol-3-phosphate 5-kinase